MGEMRTQDLVSCQTHLPAWAHKLKVVQAEYGTQLLPKEVCLFLLACQSHLFSASSSTSHNQFSANTACAAMTRGTIQNRFAVSSETAVKIGCEKKAEQDLENGDVCIEVCNRVVAALGQGLPVDVACASAHIGRTTFYRWLQRAHLPDAPQALQSFRDGVLLAKRTPKETRAASVAKPFAMISKAVANPRPHKTAVESVAAVGRPKPPSGALSCLACNLYPYVTYLNYRYFPELFRSSLLETIHLLALDFPLDTKLSMMTDDERCAFNSLVSAVAQSSCKLPAPITFLWYGSMVTVSFTDFEFTRSIIHRLVARYIRDHQRHKMQSTHSPLPEAHHNALENDHADVAVDMLDDGLTSVHSTDEDEGEDGRFASNLDDCPAHCAARSWFSCDGLLISDGSLAGMKHFQELPIFMPELPQEFNHMADFS